MAPRKTTKPASKAPPKRKKSKLSIIGDDAQRKALLAELKAQGWSLSATAEALDLGGVSNVIRAIRSLGIEEEYEKAKARGDIKPGKHSN